MQTTQMKAALLAFRDAIQEIKNAFQEADFGGHITIQLEAAGYAHHDGLQIKAAIHVGEWVYASSLDVALEEALRRHGFRQREEQKLLTVASSDCPPW